MRLRHAVSARLLVAIALVAGLFPVGSARTVEAICPAPVAEMPMGCCPESAPPACPACPSESRSSCPVQPAPARESSSLAALPPGGLEDEAREYRSGELDEPNARATSPSPARFRVRERRDVVIGASPPVRLLACTFRN